MTITEVSIEEDKNIFNDTKSLDLSSTPNLNFKFDGLHTLYSLHYNKTLIGTVMEKMGHTSCSFK